MLEVQMTLTSGRMQRSVIQVCWTCKGWIGGKGFGQKDTTDGSWVPRLEGSSTTRIIS